MGLRNRLLTTLHDERSFQPTPVLTSNVTVRSSEWQERPAAEILADFKQLVAKTPKPRMGSGLTFKGMPIEIDPRMPEGWFGLREPGKTRYAGPLPMSSLGIFYREGDIVGFGPDTMRQLLQRAMADRV